MTLAQRRPRRRRRRTQRRPAAPQATGAAPPAAAAFSASIARARSSRLSVEEVDVSAKHMTEECAEWHRDCEREAGRVRRRAEVAALRPATAPGQCVWLRLSLRSLPLLAVPGSDPRPPLLRHAAVCDVLWQSLHACRTDLLCGGGGSQHSERATGGGTGNSGRPEDETDERRHFPHWRPDQPLSKLTRMQKAGFELFAPHTCVVRWCRRSLVGVVWSGLSRVG